MAVVRQGNKFGYVNEVGKEITPIIYDEAGDFKGLYAQVSIAENSGFINRDGKELADGVAYRFVSDFKEGLASVFNGQKWGYIDMNGVVVIPFICEYADSFFENGYAIVRIKGNYGVYNNKGEAVVRPRYTYKQAQDKVKELIWKSLTEASK